MPVTVASLQGDIRYTITTLRGCEREEWQHYFWLLHPFIYSLVFYSILIILYLSKTLKAAWEFWTHMERPCLDTSDLQQRWLSDVIIVTWLLLPEGRQGITVQMMCNKQSGTKLWLLGDRKSFVFHPVPLIPIYVLSPRCGHPVTWDEKLLGQDGRQSGWAWRVDHRPTCDTRKLQHAGWL